MRLTGYGVLRMDEDDDLEVLDAGVVRCSPEEPLALRLAELAAGLNDVLDEHPADVLAIEEIYSHYRQPRTAILMAHARGAFLLEAARRNIRIIHLPSTTVKRHLTGHGRATKEQMQRAVADSLRLRQMPEPADVADALALAVCGASVVRQPARLANTNDKLLTHRGKR